MLEIKNVTKTFNDLTALDGINLSIAKGSICGVIGKSGAGKSTLIRCVNLLEKPDTGSISIDGIDLTSLSNQGLREQRHNIGMIFQHFNLLSSKTVYENVALPLKLLGKDKITIDKAIKPLLDITGLTNKSHSYPAQLSGGQKQRVAIARALVNNPKMLLCDEATSALDPKTTKSILNLLKKINKKFGITILLITHEIDVVKEICDQVAVLEQGKLIEQATTLELFTTPKTDTAKELVRNALKLELPEAIIKRLHIESSEGKVPVVRIQFVGDSTTEPLMSSLANKFNLDFNILQANIDLVQEQTIGNIVLEILGNEQDIKNGYEFLNNQGVNTEVIGYVANND